MRVERRPSALLLRPEPVLPGVLFEGARRLRCCPRNAEPVVEFFDLFDRHLSIALAFFNLSQIPPQKNHLYPLYARNGVCASVDGPRETKRAEVGLRRIENDGRLLRAFRSSDAFSSSLCCVRAWVWSTTSLMIPTFTSYPLPEQGTPPGPGPSGPRSGSGRERLGVPLPASGGQGRALRGFRPALGRRTARVAQATRRPYDPSRARNDGLYRSPRQSKSCVWDPMRSRTTLELVVAIRTGKWTTGLQVLDDVSEFGYVRGFTTRENQAVRPRHRST